LVTTHSRQNVGLFHVDAASRMETELDLASASAVEVLFGCRSANDDGNVASAPATLGIARRKRTP
jgi:hypothetical protein